MPCRKASTKIHEAVFSPNESHAMRGRLPDTCAAAAGGQAIAAAPPMSVMKSRRLSRCGVIWRSRSPRRRCAGPYGGKMRLSTPAGAALRNLEDISPRPDLIRHCVVAYGFGVPEAVGRCRVRATQCPSEGVAKRVGLESG